MCWRSWSMSCSMLMATRCAWGRGSRAICGGERISTTSVACSASGVRHWLAPPPASPHTRRADRRICSGDSGDRRPALRSRCHDACLHVPTGHADRPARPHRDRVVARDAPAAGHARCSRRSHGVRCGGHRSIGDAGGGTALLASASPPCTRRQPLTSARPRRPDRTLHGRCRSSRRPAEARRRKAPPGRSENSCSGR